MKVNTCPKCDIRTTEQECKCGYKFEKEVEPKEVHDSHKKKR
jgi:hypothetical protein